MSTKNRPKVTVFSKNNCIPCEQTKKFLQDHHIDFIERNVQGKDNHSNLIEFRDEKKYDNIPIVEIERNGQLTVISGFQKQKLMKELKIKPRINIEQLNQDIKHFDALYPVTADMETTFSGISRMIMLDRYAFKDTEKKTLKEGDLVVLTVKDDPNYPVRGIGFIDRIFEDTQEVIILIEDEYRGSLEGIEKDTGRVKRTIDSIDKPLEVYFEQIAKRNAAGLVDVEEVEENKRKLEERFYEELSNLRLIPAGRVLYGVGTDSDATLFNCYVMPMPKDSRSGLGEHRQEVMEIMSRGGGAGTNGSTLRPRNTLVKGVNGKSSGSVSWLDDLSQLTHLVQQGGSRRGAQMLQMQISHPDIIEFIISKMQNPNILKFIKNTTKDKQIKELAQEKLKFTPLTKTEKTMYETIVRYSEFLGQGGFDENVIKNAKDKLKDGGTYSVHNADALTGANISVAITDDFMEAVNEDEEWPLRFPAVESYDDEEMKIYNETWHEVGDVREWEALGHEVRTYRMIRAKDLWELINICATYAAEPGVFFIDRANKEANSQAYGQKVVATNPCGEQPLAPYSVCNLSAINLANMVNKETNEVDYVQLEKTVRVGVRLLDNVIDTTPYFLEENKKQALGERRIGLGVMGLADLLIYSGNRYGSPEGNKIIDRVFKTIAITAYEESIELSKEKGSFPFLIGETKEETQKLRNKFINSGYMKRMPEHIRQGVLKYGIRNSTTLTVAPTGSTGSMVGVGTGLEPYFAFKYFRSGRLGKFIEVNSPIVQEYFDKHPNETELPDYFVSAMELTTEEHVDVQTTIQRWVDSSISKTVNAPKGYTVKEVEKVYEDLYKGGAKGGTVYVDGSRDTQVLTLGKEVEKEDTTPVQFARTTTVESEEELKEILDDLTPKFLQNTTKNDDDTIYGVQVGNTCPVCRQGTVEDIGGCNTCTNCKAQLTCGL